MTFRCNDCHRTIRTIADVRNCSRCQSSGRATSIPAHHNDSDWITPALIGYALGGGFSSHHSHTESAPAPAPEFSGGGGEYSGAGASGSWDSGSSSSSSSDSSSSSSDSGSSDSGSSGGSSD